MRLLFRGIVVTVAVCAGLQSQTASAEDFQERWSIVPKAHAQPVPEGMDQKPNSPEQKQNSPAQNTPEPRSTPTRDPPSASKSFNKKFSGKASYNREGMTAAHRSLPFGASVRVTDIASSRSVIVRIVDRGPWIRDRVLDLSLGAARSLGNH